MGKSSMKGLLRSLLKFKLIKSKVNDNNKSRSKVRSPLDVVRCFRDLLFSLHNELHLHHHAPKFHQKIEELGILITELKCILYGTSESEPNPEACALVTQEFFHGDMLRLLIICLPELDLEARKDATQVVANLQRQQVHSRLIACDYLESNTDLLDILVLGYKNHRLALHYGNMLRECIRHQSIAKYVLESHTWKFFDYIQLPDFDVSSDAAATFKELLTRHKSTVAEFLSIYYDRFFGEFNTKLLQSPVYITRRQAIKLLGEILLDRSNTMIMVRYVSSTDNLKILMDLLREPSKPIQLEAFHVFKLFAANRNKPSDILRILIANRSKLLRVIGSFKIDREDDQFEADKAQVIKEIAELDLGEIRSLA